MRDNHEQLFDLRDLLMGVCREIRCAERQIHSFLERRAESAHDVKLREILEHHRRETEKHEARLDAIFTNLNEKAPPKKRVCLGVEGIIRGTDEILDRCQTPEIRDAALVERVQHMIHYEIATYGTAVAWSKLLGLEAVTQVLLETLKDEKNTDQELSILALDTLNMEAR